MNSTFINDFDLLDFKLFSDDTYLKVFEYLRENEPVYRQSGHPEVGDFWNITKYKDIVAVDTNHQIYSSEGSFLAQDMDKEFPLPMFMAMDDPLHNYFRRLFLPVFQNRNIADLEEIIRDKTRHILSALPLNERINWVEHVSIELTSQILAVIFDFPIEDRSKLVKWSNAAIITAQNNQSPTDRRNDIMECLDYFSTLWESRKHAPENKDLLSLYIHSEDGEMRKPSEFLGNVLMLIVAGNDTTRNSITGGVHALNLFPKEAEKVRNNHDLIPNMVAEIIRWQTPLAYMRRTALVDTLLGDKQIKAGEKLLMWYASGNMDEEVFPDPTRFDVNRENAKKHISFGNGIHKCMGAKLSEMQLNVLWQEIYKAGLSIQVVDDPVMIDSPFTKGYVSLDVVVTR